jgi:hypothetical protein
VNNWKNCIFDIFTFGFQHFFTLLENSYRPVLPGGRGHRQITQNRPYKKIICGEKLMAVKVAVSGNKVL